MGDLHSRGAFVLRTPARPFDAWRAEPKLTPEVRDALSVASPDTLAALDRGDPGALDALRRFGARMAGRPTPFGLFAGWSTGTLGDEARLEVGAGRPRSRLDMQVLDAVVERLRADPAVRRLLTYHPNPTLYRAGGRLHYVEHRSGRLVAITPDDDLSRVLDRAHDGAPFADLAATLVVAGAAPAHAEAYLDALIDAEVLVGDLVLPVTGPEPTMPLIRRLHDLAAEAALRAAAKGEGERPLPGTGAAALKGAAEALEAAERELRAADASPPGARAAAHGRVRVALEGLGVPLDPARMVQVDLPREAAGLTLPAAVLEDVRRGVEVLRRLAPRRGDELAGYRERFERRYRTRPVPLAAALDPETGVGYERSDEPLTPETSPVLLGLLLEASTRGLTEVELDVASLTGLVPAALPGAFSVMAVLGARQDGGFDVRPLHVLGPSGANLLGRFCHADPSLERAVREHLAAEEAREPDAVFAEIAHLPDARTGNVLLRPRLREHAIALDAPGGLRLDDLVLALEDGELVLRSLSLGRRVLPRLSTAHNFDAHGIGLYSFLGALARHGAHPLAWGWGPLAAAPFTPRVRCGRLVLDVARWAVPSGLEDVDAWREATGVPELVALGGFDAPLPVDLSTRHGQELLLQERPSRVAEWWPAPDAMPVTGPGGRYAHELVIPFTTPPPPAKAPRRVATGRPIARTLPPGSGWLYARLYAGAALHDALIVDELAPLGRAADAWHVVRYADPDEHLRVRFQGDPDDLRARILPRVEAIGRAAIADGRAWRLTLDTYERELERYGGSDGIEACEAIFAADSDCVAELLAAEPRGHEAAERRWRLGAASALRLVLDLGFTADEATALLRAARGELDRDARRRLAAAVRAQRATLEPLIATALSRGGAPGAGPVAAALDRRSARVAAPAARLDRQEDVARALVHMHLNRLLRLPAADQEIAACDAAQHLLRGARARSAAVA